MSDNRPCEVCSDRAIMCLLANNPGTPPLDYKRNDDPFDPQFKADLALNLCADCFHETAQELRNSKYVNVRGTGYLINKERFVNHG